MPSIYHVLVCYVIIRNGFGLFNQKTDIKLITISHFQQKRPKYELYGIQRIYKFMAKFRFFLRKPVSATNPDVCGNLYRLSVKVFGPNTVNKKWQR